jgi:hypothetical protein
MLNRAMAQLASDALRAEVLQMQQELEDSLLKLGARKAFVALCSRLRGRLAMAQEQGEEIHTMLRASHARLNAEFAFGLALDAAPDLRHFGHELEMIEAGYTRYLGLGQALRLSQPRFLDRFTRMLVSKLRVVFESAAGEIELWNKSALSHLESQLAERRRAFRRRAEALTRIQLAAGELEQRIAELTAQDAAVAVSLKRAEELTQALQALAPPEVAAGSAAQQATADVAAGAVAPPAPRRRAGISKAATPRARKRA